MKNINNKLANNNNYIDLMVGIMLMTLMTAWAAAIAVGFGFYYSGRYVEEWLLIAIWFHLGCFIVRGLEIVFDGVGCAIRVKHRQGRRDRSATPDGAVWSDEELAAEYEQWTRQVHDNPAEKRAMVNPKMVWCHKLNAFVVFAITQDGSEEIIGKIQFEHGNTPGLSHACYMKYIREALELANKHGFYLIDNKPYRVGQKVWLEKVQGEPEHDGLRGEITEVRANGMLYGTWGDFGVDPSVDSIVTINN